MTEHENRVVALLSTISNKLDKLDSIDQEIGNLKEGQQELKAGQKDLNARLLTLEQGQKVLQQDVGGLKIEMVGVHQKIGTLQFDMENLKKELITSREIQRGLFTTLDNRFQDMTERLLRQLQQITDLQMRDQLSVPRNEIKRLRQDVDELKARDTEKEKRIALLESRGK